MGRCITPIHSYSGKHRRADSDRRDSVVDNTYMITIKKGKLTPEEEKAKAEYKKEVHKMVMEMSKFQRRENKRIIQGGK